MKRIENYRNKFLVEKVSLRVYITLQMLIRIQYCSFFGQYLIKYQ